MRVAVEAFALLCVLLCLHVRPIAFGVKDSSANSIFPYPDTVEWAAKVLLGRYLRGLSVQRVNQVYSLVYFEA